MQISNHRADKMKEELKQTQLQTQLFVQNMLQTKGKSVIKSDISKNSPHGLIGSLAPPLNPSRDNIDGDNIREKFANFLIAETEESPNRNKKVK